MAGTWSYEVSLPTDKDKVRLVIGDTDTDDQLLLDEEIQFFIDEHGSVQRAASESCRAIAAMFARNMSRSIGGLQADFSAKYRQYLQLAESIDTNEQLTPVSPYASGYLKSQKQTQDDNEDREPIIGRKGVTDNPRVGPVNDSQYLPSRTY